MNTKKRSFFAFLFALCISITFFFFLPPLPTFAEENCDMDTDVLSLSCPSAILMEATTGGVLYEKASDAPLPMASVTKVMTMLLIFEAIDEGQLSLSTDVTVSEHAASMGGSQVFLEAGEVQPVETLLKCISIASANDASVAMAEAIAGSEEAFVSQMNKKAASLGMTNTHFINCCGLDASEHYSCAKDLAILSRELILRFPAIYDYCQTWQEDIVHTTARGQTPFTLTNTNKLLKSYPYATGLKTGSTSAAKFCLSATAQKDSMTLIAIIMASPTSKDRVKDAQTLFTYGFANAALYHDKTTDQSFWVNVKKGTKEQILAIAKQDFSYLDQSKQDLGKIKSKKNLPTVLFAPIKKGDTIGSIDYYLKDTKIGSVPVVATENVASAGYKDTLKQMFYSYCLFSKSDGK